MSHIRPWILVFLALVLPPWVATSHAAKREGSLPSLAVISNLRSPSGRSLYLLIRAKDQAIEREAQTVAASVGAKIAIRRAGTDLWIAYLFHAGRGLDVHRHGRYLTIGTQPLPASGPILPADAGIKLPGPRFQEASHKEKDPNENMNQAAHQASDQASERFESDLDQEILLRARLHMRDQQAKPSLVATAQGAAARLVLFRFAKGDDVGAAHAGQRHQPLLTAHPDHGLLKEVILAAIQNLDVPEDPRTEDPRKGQEEPQDPGKEATTALAEADLSIKRAKDYLAIPPKPTNQDRETQGTRNQNP